MNTSSLTSQSLNRKERKAQRLLQHYATCEQLALYLATSTALKGWTGRKCPFCEGTGEIMGHDQEVSCTLCAGTGDEYGPILPQFDGKRISVALFKAEQLASKGAELLCSDPEYTQKIHDWTIWRAKQMVRKALGVLPPGFFVNSDPRGYALKIDCDNAQGKALIDAVGLPTDMGGYGLLSPETAEP